MSRVLAAMLLLVFASVSGAAPLPDDPALAKQVTLAVKGEALVDVLKMMQAQTGVKLRVDRDIADRKVTIFLDEKPLRDVMNGLVTVFGYRWSADAVSGSKAYRLWEDEKTRREREDRRTKAYTKAWENADAIFGYMTQFAQLESDGLKQLVDKLGAEYAEKKGEETRLKLAAAKNLSADPRSRVIAEYYQALPESVQNTIKSGMTVHFDSASSEPEWKLPENAAGQLGEATKSKFVSGPLIRRADGTVQIGGEQDEWKLDGVNLGYSAIITNESAGLDAAVLIRQKITTVTPASGQTPAGTSVQEQALSTIFSLARERVLMADVSSARRLPHKEDGALAGMKVSFDVEDIVKETGIEASVTGAPASRSDILAILHRKLGLQIISDHYSQWHTWTEEKSRDVEQFLPVFGQKNMYQGQPVRDVDWGWDGSYCYLRSMDAANCDVRETPNRLLRPWQTAYAKNGFLGVDELGQISMLPGEQISGLKANARYLGLGDEVVTSKELQLHGMLTAGQRADAFGKGIKLADMTPEQRSLAAQMGYMHDGRWAQPGGGGPVVGVYQNGVRIDKPEQSDNPYAPVEIGMRLKEAPYRHHFKMKNEIGPGYVKDVEANTSDEAWQKVLAEMPDAKEKLNCFQQRWFSVIVMRAQGSTHETGVYIPVLVPYSETPESGGAKVN